jgi:hypothetical protein
LTLVLWLIAGNTFAASILFIGNSFTFAYGSPVRYYRADSVIDLNSAGQGGVPALFKSFASQAGLSYEVYLETEPGVGIDWHLEHKLEVIGQRPWDAVVMHGFSTLDPKKPGDPTLLAANVRQMAQFLRTKNSKADIRIMATWPRADQVYQPKGAWYGKPIESMAHDVRDGYDRAAAGTAGITVVPVGDAWVRAMLPVSPTPIPTMESTPTNEFVDRRQLSRQHLRLLPGGRVFGSITGRSPLLGANGVRA